MMSNGDLTFLRNNVWRIYLSIKRRRLIEYSKVNGVPFFTKIHSSIKNENSWFNGFSFPVFFSHGRLTHPVFQLVILVKGLLSSINRKKKVKLEKF